MLSINWYIKDCITYCLLHCCEWIFCLFAGLCKERVPVSDVGCQLTFISLKTRITNLLLKALKAEQDSQNTQLLLAGTFHLLARNTSPPLMLCWSKDRKEIILITFIFNHLKFCEKKIVLEMRKLVTERRDIKVVKLLASIALMFLYSIF